MKRSLDEGYVLERSDCSLGPVELSFGIGSSSEFEAICLPGRSLCVLIVGEGSDRAGVIAIAFDEVAGSYIQMEPDSLRHMAMGMARMADELDGGKGKQ